MLCNEQVVFKEGNQGGYVGRGVSGGRGVMEGGGELSEELVRVRCLRGEEGKG